MFSLPNFCRVCLKYDKNLIDLAHIENEPNETLLSKLQQCVAEVDWNVCKPLLCHPCIKRLNIAYTFKKQCVQSAGVLKNYLELVQESQKRNESTTLIACENISSSGGTLMLLPNQKYVKILVGPQPQSQVTTNTFQNVFLNLIPATTVTATTVPETVISESPDNNLNVFLNLNKNLKKFVPIAPNTGEKKSTPGTTVTPIKTENNVNVNQLLTESKTEEVSVEIDPTDFAGFEEDDFNGNFENEENSMAAADYDDLISLTKIESKELQDEKLNNGNSSDSCQNENGMNETDKLQRHFVPILPKPDDFINSGQHFLYNSAETPGDGDVNCERCQKNFSSARVLKAHIKQFHLGKMPFKCEFCFAEFAVRSTYEMCVMRHKEDRENVNNSLTLHDFENSPILDARNSLEENCYSDFGDFSCDVCNRPFHSSTGLIRHKVRKHNQKTKKKYFIKGMKNARCDICNREFSTQSYMQLHRKLHLRNDIGYKYKVFGKSRYETVKSNDKVIKDELMEGDDGDDSDSQDQDSKNITLERNDDDSEDGMSDEN